MVQLKKRLPVLLDKEKLLNKFHWGKNSPTHLPKIATINKNQNINTETNISKKLTGCVKRDTFDIFYEFVLENFKEENIDGLQKNEKQRSSLGNDKNVDTAWLTSTIKSAKTNIMAETSKNTTINDYVKNEKEDTRETIIHKRNNAVRRTVRTVSLETRDVLLIFFIQL